MMSDIAIEIQETGVDNYGLLKTKCANCSRYLLTSRSKAVGKCGGCRGEWTKHHYSNDKSLAEESHEADRLDFLTGR